MHVDYDRVLKQFRGKRIFITGNTGFKGTWLTAILLRAGAFVTGYAVDIPTSPNLFSMIRLEADKNLHQIYGDIRNFEKLISAFKDSRPEIVFHLAAQPIVRDSYRDPLNTYSTNVMGTVNICECVRLSKCTGEEGGFASEDYGGVKSFLNVTTDKVYRNFEWEYGYREEDLLDGYDPYSNSKSCSELITNCYKHSFFQVWDIGVSTARAGNVIGGGDFAKDRIIPDSVRAMKEAYEKGTETAEIKVRNPFSIRPYQHVLEPLFAYLTIAIEQYKDKERAGCYNVGPDDCDCLVTGRLVDLFCSKWNECKELYPKAVRRNTADENVVHEASFLKLDISRIKHVLGWTPRWHIDKAVEETVCFSRVWVSGGDVVGELNREIDEYLSGF